MRAHKEAITLKAYNAEELTEQSVAFCGSSRIANTIEDHQFPAAEFTEDCVSASRGDNSDCMG